MPSSCLSTLYKTKSLSLEQSIIPLREGTKKPIGEWKDEENRVSLSEAPQNYAVYPSGGLAFIDIDDEEKAPQQLLDRTEGTFTVDSPHGEHRWILVDEEIPNVRREWGELRATNQYVVGPGSILTECKHGCCTPDSPGKYTIQNDSDPQQFDKDELKEWIGGFERDTPDEENGEVNTDSLPEIDEGKLQYAEKVLKELQRESTPLFNCLMDRLNGGRGDMGDSLTKDGRKIDRSRSDFVTVGHLYGVLLNHGLSHERSKELARHTYTHYSRENPYTKDGQPRKWVTRGNEYRRMILRHAIRQFDETQFRRLLNRSNTTNWGDYSDITYSFASFVIDWLIEGYDPELAQEVAGFYGLGIEVAELQVVQHHMYQGTPRGSTGGLQCEYPTPKSVREVCSALDRNGESTYRRVLKRSRKDGNLKLACLEEGVDYRVYPADCQDPPGAEWIRTDGEEYQPVATHDETVLPPIAGEVKQ